MSALYRSGIGIISDTHGLLRPEGSAMARWVAHIIHAGDMGRADVLVELRRIAPVTAIRGNIDTGDWAGHYPDTLVRFGERSFYVSCTTFSNCRSIQQFAELT